MIAELVGLCKQVPVGSILHSQNLLWITMHFREFTLHHISCYSLSFRGILFALHRNWKITCFSLLELIQMADISFFSFLFFFFVLFRFFSWILWCQQTASYGKSWRGVGLPALETIFHWGCDHVGFLSIIYSFHIPVESLFEGESLEVFVAPMLVTASKRCYLPVVFKPQLLSVSTGTCV